MRKSYLDWLAMSAMGAEKQLFVNALSRHSLVLL